MSISVSYDTHCATGPAQECRVCGCTAADCTSCVERSEDGEPCTWVDDDLCSVCDSGATQDEINEVKALVEQTYWADGIGPEGMDWAMAIALRRALPLLEHGHDDEALTAIVFAIQDGVRMHEA